MTPVGTWMRCSSRSVNTSGLDRSLEQGPSVLATQNVLGYIFRPKAGPQGCLPPFDQYSPKAIGRALYFPLNPISWPIRKVYRHKLNTEYSSSPPISSTGISNKCLYFVTYLLFNLQKCIFWAMHGFKAYSKIRVWIKIL